MRWKIQESISNNNDMLKLTRAADWQKLGYLVYIQ